MSEVEPMLERVTDGLREAVHEQQAGNVALESLSDWGWALSELTATAEDASRLLDRQLATYGGQRLIRDDEGGDPYQRLSAARGHLDSLAVALRLANEAARAYHSAIGHIAVDAQLEALEVDDPERVAADFYRRTKARTGVVIPPLEERYGGQEQ